MYDGIRSFKTDERTYKGASPTLSGRGFRAPTVILWSTDCRTHPDADLYYFCQCVSPKIVKNCDRQ